MALWKPIFTSSLLALTNIYGQDSFYPRHLKTDIPYGQALRLTKDVRDTTDFLNKLNSLPSLPPGSVLVALNISSLCTNIPQDEVVAACEEALNSRELLMPPTADLFSSYKTNFYLRIHLLLTRNII